MTEIERIQFAKELADKINSSVFSYKRYNRNVGREVTETIPGADRDELKKLHAFLLAHPHKNGFENFRKLIDKLPESDFADRSNQTKGYFMNIKKGLEETRFFELITIEDATHILGWTCRFLPPKEDKGSFGGGATRKGKPNSNWHQQKMKR